MGFEPGLCDPEQLWVPKEAAHSQETLGTRFSARQQKERKQPPQELAAWVEACRCQAARLPGSCRQLTGPCGPSSRICHHGNHCQGISSLVCIGGLPGCGCGWLAFRCGRRLEGGGRQTLFTHTIPKSFPQLGVLGRTFQKQALEKVRAMGNARCRGEGGRRKEADHVGFLGSSGCAHREAPHTVSLLYKLILIHHLTGSSQRRQRVKTIYLILQMKVRMETALDQQSGHLRSILSASHLANPHSYQPPISCL